MRTGADDVHLIFNDLSIHEQFTHSFLFGEAIDRIMVIRRMAAGFERQLYCHRGTLNRLVDPTTSVFQEVQGFPLAKKIAILLWLQKQGPFWEDSKGHDPDEVFECQGEIVTETAVAEAAYGNTGGTEQSLVSVTPSGWNYSPLTVEWVGADPAAIHVQNFWDSLTLESALQHAQSPISSWKHLEEVCRLRFERLSFAGDSFRDLDGRPFVYGAAERILTLLDVLGKLMGSADSQGHWSAEGQRLYQNYFVGCKARFTDSSVTEKRDFKQKLTFPGPDGRPLFCTWHGKVNNPPFRVHFSWPETPGEQLYIAYVGWKITIQ